MDSSEIRQLKLEKYKADYEERKRLANITYWILIPTIVSFFIATKDEIGKALSSPFVELIQLMPNLGLKISVIFLFFILLITIAILAPFLVGRLLHALENKYASALRSFKENIDKLIEDA